MKPSTKVELAIAGMIEMASSSPSKPLSLAVLAEKQSISLSYLEQVFASLRRYGLIVSVRGPGGGYLLSRPAHQINTGSIVLAIEGKPPNSNGVTVNQDAAASNEVENVLDAFWARMSDEVLQLYSNVSLQDIIDGKITMVSRISEIAPQAAE